MRLATMVVLYGYLLRVSFENDQLLRPPTPFPKLTIVSNQDGFSAIHELQCLSSLSLCPRCPFGRLSRNFHRSKIGSHLWFSTIAVCIPHFCCCGESCLAFLQSSRLQTSGSSEWNNTSTVHLWPPIQVDVWASQETGWITQFGNSRVCFAVACLVLAWPPGLNARQLY